MNFRIIRTSFFFLLLTALTGHGQDNALTAKEKKEGWVPLFNGKDLSGWKTVKGGNPESDWKVEAGELSIRPDVKGHQDIISEAEYSNFELRLDFKLTEGANSGIKYFFTRYETGGWLGFEYQLIDNERHADAKLGRDGNRQLGTLYDVLPIAGKTEVKPGEWNQVRIVVSGNQCTHYLNGKKLLSFDKSSASFNEARALSKFKDARPLFGSVPGGHILLQDHGDLVFFKNVKIKKL